MRKRARCSLPLDDLSHLFSDCSDLRAGGVCGLLDLVWPPLGESDGEESEEVVIDCLYSHVSFDESLPFADERSQLVRREVEAVEVSQAVLALDFVYSQLDLSKGVVLVFLEVGQGDFENAALQSIIGVLETSSPVDQRLPNTIVYIRFFLPGRCIDYPYSRSWNVEGAC